MGSHTLTAVATDNQGATGKSAPINFLVNAPPQVTLSSPGAEAVFRIGDRIEVYATATDPDGTIVKV